MLLSPDAMTILVGLLNDMSLMQRKIAAGQGAECEIALIEGRPFYIRLEVRLDPDVVVVAPVPSQES